MKALKRTGGSTTTTISGHRRQALCSSRSVFSTRSMWWQSRRTGTQLGRRSSSQGTHRRVIRATTDTIANSFGYLQLGSQASADRRRPAIRLDSPLPTAELALSLRPRARLHLFSGDGRGPSSPLSRRSCALARL
ncbi:hypothetical protein SEVIR_9G347950v4 [Setaria viridis]